MQYPSVPLTAHTIEHNSLIVLCLSLRLQPSLNPVSDIQRALTFHHPLINPPSLSLIITMYPPHPTAYPHHTKTQDESIHQHPPHPPLRHRRATAQQQQPVALPSQTSAPRQPRLRPHLAGLSYHRHAVEVQENASEEERGTARGQPSHHPTHACGTACAFAPQRFEGESGFCFQLSARSG